MLSTDASTLPLRTLSALSASAFTISFCSSEGFSTTFSNTASGTSSFSISGVLISALSLNVSRMKSPYPRAEYFLIILSSSEIVYFSSGIIIILFSLSLLIMSEALYNASFISFENPPFANIPLWIY